MNISSLGLKGRIGLPLAASFAGLLCLNAYFSVYLTNKTIEFEKDRLRNFVHAIADEERDKVEDVFQSMQWLSRQIGLLKPSTPGCNELLAGEQIGRAHV